MERRSNPDSVIEYELLPRTARIRRKLDGVEDEGRLALLCHGEASLGRGGAVDRWWWEKLWILLDQLQVFAAVWLASCPGATTRFPMLWCLNTAWSPYLNIDVQGSEAWVAKTANATNTEVLPNGTGEGGDAAPGSGEALWIMVTPAIVTGFLWIYFRMLQAPFKEGLELRARFVPAVERAVLRLGSLGFLPWCVYVARHVTCLEMGVLVEWQRVYTCATFDASQAVCRARSACEGGGGGGAAAAVGIWLAIAFTSLGFPALVWYAARPGVLFRGRSRHEGWLQGIETEYLLRFSSYWSHHHYALHSSHTRPWAFGLPYTLLVKLAIGWALAAPGGGAGGDQVRDALLLAILGGWLAAAWWARAYRLASSQLLLTVLLGCNVVTMIPRCLLSAGFRSEMWLRLGIMLIIHHCLAIALALLVLAQFRGERWPVTGESIHAHDQFTCEAYWHDGASDTGSDGETGSGGGGGGAQRDPHFLRRETTGSESGIEGRVEVAVEGDDQVSLGFPWIEGDGGDLLVARRVERARRVLLQEQLRTREFVRTARLRAQISRLQALLGILERGRQPLRFTVEDVMEESVAFFNQAAKGTIYYYPPLSPLLVAFRERLDRRDVFMRLAGPRLKRALLKLFSLRQFLVIRQECAERAFRAEEEAGRRAREEVARTTSAGSRGGAAESSRTPSAIMVAEEEEA